MSDTPKKFRVARKSTYKEERTVMMSLRIDRELQERYDEWAIKTNRSRNQLMNMALEYAIDQIELSDMEDES